MARSGRVADQAVAAVIFVELVAGEIEHVRVELEQVVGDGLVGKGVVLLTGQGAQAQGAPAMGWP